MKLRCQKVNQRFVELLTVLTTTWHGTPSHPSQNISLLHFLLYFPTQILICPFLNCLRVDTLKHSGQDSPCPCEIRSGHILNTSQIHFVSTVVPCILILSKFYYHLMHNCLKNNIKIYINTLRTGDADLRF